MSNKITYEEIEGYVENLISLGGPELTRDILSEFDHAVRMLPRREDSDLRVRLHFHLLRTPNGKWRLVER